MPNLRINKRGFHISDVKFSYSSFLSVPHGVFMFFSPRSPVSWFNIMYLIFFCYYK